MPGYAFPVTLGFNFGCQMERPYADSVGAFPYSYGHSGQLSNGLFFTTAEGRDGNVQLPYFSNPDRTHQGYVLGVPIGQAGESHNSQVINNTRATAAAFRARTGADVDGNGVLSPADIATFINLWFAGVQQGTLTGDFDGNGFVQPVDVAQFIGAWSAAGALSSARFRSRICEVMTALPERRSWRGRRRAAARRGPSTRRAAAAGARAAGSA